MLSQERRLLVIVIVSTLILGVFGYGWKHRTQVPFVSVALESITTPFAYGMSRVMDGVMTGVAVLDGAIGNAKLIGTVTDRNAELEQRLATHDEIVAENIRLRQLLQFKREQTYFDMVPARVITRDMGTWTYTFTIDRGSEEGIAVNMPVVVPSGVVGFISDVYPHSARVQTILDPRSAIGVIVQRPESRVASVMKGNGTNPDEPEMIHIARESDVLTGDTLVTSGYGGIYPKGILVGHVGDFVNTPEGYVKSAKVQPAANFRSIEEVFIITRSTVGEPEKPKLVPKLVPQTQRDHVEGAKGAIKQ